jgi:hypothetical protein
MARRATEGNQKPVGGKDAANEWDIEAGFSRARTGASIFPKSVKHPVHPVRNRRPRCLFTLGRSKGTRADEGVRPTKAEQKKVSSDDWI